MKYQDDIDKVRGPLVKTLMAKDQWTASAVGMMVTQDDSHLLKNILVFNRLLRRVGLPVSLEQAMDFANALTLIDIGSRDQVFYAARGLLVSRQEHLKLFEIIFNRFWRLNGGFSRSAGQSAPPAPRGQPPAQKGARAMTLMGYLARESDPGIDVFDRSETFSAVEVLQQKHFSEMTAEELDAIKRLIRDMQWQVSLRETRRRIPDPRGDMLHLRRVLRSAAKHNGVFHPLPRRRIGLASQYRRPGVVRSVAWNLPSCQLAKS